MERVGDKASSSRGVDKGGDITLGCIATGDPTPTITWSSGYPEYKEDLGVVILFIDLFEFP